MRACLKKIVFFLLLNLVWMQGWAQEANLDSLHKALAKASVDSTRIDLLNEISWQLRNARPDSSLLYAKRALQSAEQAKYIKGQIVGMNYIGVAYRNQGDYSTASEYYFKALRLAELSKNYEQIGYSQINIGNIYLYQKNYTEALNFFYAALKVADKTQDIKMQAYVYLNIGRAYRAKEEFEKAIEYYLKTLKLRERLNDKPGIATSLADIGEVYRLQKNYPKAIEYFEQALVNFEALKNQGGIAYNLNSLALIYKQQGDFGKAMEQAQKSLKIAEQFKLKNDIKRATLTISQIFELQRNFEQAFLYFKRFYMVNDSLFNEESNRKILQLNSLYESEKKQAQIDLLTKDRKLKEVEIRRSNTLIYGLVASILLGVGLVVVLVRSNRLKQRTNVLLKSQKKEIEIQNQQLNAQNIQIEQKSKALQEAYKEIQDKNQDVLDSLNYAKSIQNAILQTPKTLEKLFPESFVFIKPRDIVSGDFFWTCDLPQVRVLAAADCTGHGIPGAFMSLITNDLLDQIILIKGIQAPEVILQNLRKGIIKALRQNENQNQDGVDITVCVIHKDPLQEGKYTHIELAGTSLPFVYFQQSEIQVIKPAISPIGGLHMAKNKDFVKYNIPIEQPTTFYLYSDGYQDQFGGDNKKKLSAKSFRELLSAMHHRPLQEQRDILEHRLKTWMQDQKQVDDILVVGVRLNAV